MAKERLDKALVRRGLAVSRTRAQRIIEEGHATLDGMVVCDSSLMVDDDAALAVVGDNVPWVSRGALKLLHALDTWKVDVAGKRCLDIGASTGGFTEVLLARGAARVIALDVGTNQLADKLLADDRVYPIEGTNIKTYTPGSGDTPPEIIVIDVSFISLQKVLPKAAELLAPHGSIIALIKPQFEVGKGNTKSGIVIDPKKREEAVAKVAAHVRALGFSIEGPIYSPIEGGGGNVEYLILATR